MVMQDVNHQLFTNSVLSEVLLSMEHPDEKAAEKILESLDLDEYKEKHPMALSGGQKQRVAIASAIAAQAQILLFDEPTSGLDYRHMREVAELLKRLAAEGKTIFVYRLQRVEIRRQLSGALGGVDRNERIVYPV